MSCPQDFTSGVLHNTSTTLGTFYVGRSSSWSQPLASGSQHPSAAPDGAYGECKDGNGNDEDKGGGQGGEGSLPK